MARHLCAWLIFPFFLALPIGAQAEPSSSIKTERGMIRVPDGFTIERVAGPPLVGHPMLANFDERGRLFIAESAGKNLRPAELETELPNFVRMLEDTDDDGVFDKSTIFADKMTLPMGALPYRGSVYVAAPPNIWRLQDTDDDGVADKREILVGKFGYNGNAASIHGPFLSPTGRIYWCDGRHGHEFRDDVGAVTSKKRGSGIFSMRPDGSDVRMFCGGGMDNPVEVDFMPTGEVIGSVNILYTKPRIDCLVHWQDGGVYPHQEASIAEFTQTGDLLGPITKFGHVAVSGMCRYRSSGLGEEFKDTIFTSIFNSGKLIHSKIERSGGTFKTTETEFLSSDDPDFHPTDVLEDADGSLLLIDTGGWFRIGCPTSQIAKPDIAGAIYRIRRADLPVLNDPRGRELSIESLNRRELCQALDDPRPVVVNRTMDYIAENELFDSPRLQSLINSKNGNLSLRGKINLAWAVSRNISPDRAAFLQWLIHWDNPVELKIAAANALTDSYYGQPNLQIDVSRIESGFRDARSAALRRSLARLLGIISLHSKKYRDQAIKKAVVLSLLKETGRIVGTADREPTDREAEHAIILAVIRLRDIYNTNRMLRHFHPAVKKSALIALDQMEGDNLSREAVVELLATVDEALRNAALDVISRHDGWASETVSLLSDWLHDQRLLSGRTPMIRGFLRSQTADQSVQQLVADLLEETNLPRESRLLLLEVISESGLQDLPSSWKTRLSQELSHEDGTVRHQAVKTVAPFELADFDARLLKLAHDESQSVELRIDAFSATAQRLSDVSNEDVRFLLEQLSEDIAPLTRLAAARTLLILPLSDSQRMSLAKKLSSAGSMTAGILLQNLSRDLNDDLAEAVLDSLKKLPAEVRLPGAELLAFAKNVPKLLQAETQDFARNRLGTSHEKALQGKQSLLVAGNAERGREIFFDRRTACSSCHTISGQGGKVGPDLTKIGAIRKQRDLLEAIMFPSSSFARGYKTWTIVTDRGRVHSGLITRETTDSLTLRRTDLSEFRIARDSIDEMHEATTSVMPEGLHQRLSNQELSNLLEYLASLK